MLGTLSLSSQSVFWNRQMCQEQYGWCSASFSMSYWSLLQTSVPPILRCHMHTCKTTSEKHQKDYKAVFKMFVKNGLCASLYNFPIFSLLHTWWDSQQCYYCLSAIFSSGRSIWAHLYSDVSLLSRFFCPSLDEPTRRASACPGCPYFGLRHLPAAIRPSETPQHHPPQQRVQHRGELIRRISELGGLCRIQPELSCTEL